MSGLWQIKHTVREPSPTSSWSFSYTQSPLWKRFRRRLNMVHTRPPSRKNRMLSSHVHLQRSFFFIYIYDMRVNEMQNSDYYSLWKKMQSVKGGLRCASLTCRLYSRVKWEAAQTKHSFHWQNFAVKVAQIKFGALPVVPEETQWSLRWTCTVGQVATCQDTGGRCQVGHHGMKH